jgi:dTDP-4-amino-4,6-dideoxygalactose transaminase
MIPFFKPTYDPDFLPELEEVLKSGWITTGPKTKLFEQRLTEYCGNQRTLCLGSATSGLELILRWFGVGEGDEVLLPAYTYCATANVVMHCGAKPVFVEVGDDFNLSVADMKGKVTARTKVVMPVDFAGMPCDYDAINACVIDEQVRSLFRPTTNEQETLGRILVLSDAAHSLGATYKKRRSGTLADVSVFSFHAVKNLTTAEGGAVCLNLPSLFDNNDVYNKLNIKSLHGQSKDALSKNKKGEWKYDVIEPGYKCNMTDIQAALGLVSLKKYDSQTLPNRRKQFELYNSYLGAYEWAALPEYQTDTSSSSCHIYPIWIKGITEKQRDAIMEGIFADDIAVNVHFRPVPMLSYYAGEGFTMEGLDNTYRLFSSEITLPIYRDLTDDQIKKVSESVIRSVEKVIQQGG